MKPWSLKIGIAVLLIGGIWFAWYIWKCRQLLPDGENSFVEFSELLQIDVDGQVISTLGPEISIRKNTGLYTLIKLQPKQNLPSEFHGEKVQPPNRWPVSVAVFPANDTRVKTLCLSYCSPIKLPGRRKPRVSTANTPPLYLPSVGTTRYRSSKSNYEGAPSIPDGLVNETSYWTFISTLSHGDQYESYYYELRLYPTAQWISDVRSKLGKPVVLRRGLLVVSDANS